MTKRGVYRGIVALVVVVVLVAAGLVVTADSRTVVVLVVVGAGVSTTVVQEVKTVAATARAGARMMSFFIVRLLFHPDFATRALVSRMRSEVFPAHTIGTSRRAALEA